MKKLITVLFLISSFVFGQTDGLIISEVCDGNNSGGLPKYIEITNAHVESRIINGLKIRMGVNGSALVDKVTISTASSLASGDSYVIAANATDMTNAGYSAPDQTSGNITGNGNDVYAITTSDDTIIDIFGIVGTQSSWYQDKVVIRNSNINNGNISYTSSEWTFTTLSSGEPNNGAPGSPGIHNLDSPLPVELITFSASMSNGNVELNWETATEINNYGFEVERQILNQVKNNKWEMVGFVEGHGNSNSPKFYSYTDKKIEASGNYNYRLKQIDIDGTFEYSDVVEANLGAPESFELDQNYPNPFNPLTSIRFNLPMDSNVKLTVFNVLGQEVAELINENITAGYHSVNFDGSSLNSGIYFYQLETNNFTQIRKMMLVK